MKDPQPMKQFLHQRVVRHMMLYMGWHKDFWKEFYQLSLFQGVVIVTIEIVTNARINQDGISYHTLKIWSYFDKYIHHVISLSQYL